jgi:outer membrane protein insertion porin family
MWCDVAQAQPSTLLRCLLMRRSTLAVTGVLVMAISGLDQPWSFAQVNPVHAQPSLGAEGDITPPTLPDPSNLHAPVPSPPQPAPQPLDGSTDIIPSPDTPREDNQSPANETSPEREATPDTSTEEETIPDPGLEGEATPDIGSEGEVAPSTGTEEEAAPDAGAEGETTPDGTAQPEAAPEPEVLVSEVLVLGVDPNLALTVYEAISTRPGQTATRSQIQTDINSIFATGFFNNVRAEPSDTALGVRVTFFVQANPVLRGVQVAGNQVLTQEKVDEIFGPQYNRILNLNDLKRGIEDINKYYQDEGFVLGQVVGAPQIDRDGTVTLQVAEGVIEAIDVRYLNRDGEPTKGRTRKFILTRELRTKPGDPLNRDKLQLDVQRVFGLGLFEDVQVALEPGQDPRKVQVVLNVQERNTGNFSAGAGFSSSSGFFGTGSYSQSNFGGNNQDLSVQLQIGTREFLFDTSFTDPWIATDPFRTSYTVNAFNRLTLPLVFDEGPFEDVSCASVAFVPPCDVNLPNGDTPRVNRLGTGVVFTRPLTREPDKIPRAFVASAGIRYQRISIRDGDFDISPVDELGNLLSISPSGEDDLFTVQLGIGQDLRDNPLTPTRGSAFRIGLEQSAPIGNGSILMTRLRGSYSYFIPVNLLKLTKGPQALAFNVQAGTILGDLPPYEAFTLGGTSSIRGFGEGDVGSGRSFLQATAEYRFPLLNFLGGINGVLFVDAGTNLGTQDNVPGSPGIIRGKPGDGIGYGIGIRVKTPIGPVRLDYGLNSDGGERFHFGFGERF